MIHDKSQSGFDFESPRIKGYHTKFYYFSCPLDREQPKGERLESV